MDSVDEDISARVLLKKVLQTELPRSPVTRSVTRGRRSSRQKLAESPGVTLRHRLKHKLHQSASQSPLPPRKRQRSLGENADPPSPDSATGLAPPPAPPPAPSPLFDEDITARGLLRGIIQTESEVSLLVSGQPALQESELNPAESSVSSAGERTDGLSGAELSDLTLHTEPLTHVVRGLSRRKPPRAFSVSAFEKELDGIPDKAEEVVVAPQEKSDASQDLDLSSGSKSGLNLTLKTPFVDKHTERAGLQRKVSNRRLPSVDAFDEAVQKCLEQGANQDHSVVQDGKTLEDSSWQKFTLGLNDVTELYVQPAGTTAQSRKDEMLIPSAELEGDAENGEEHEPDRDEEQESRENHVSKIHDLQDPEPSKQELKEHDVEYPSQEEEEVVPSSQEAGDALSLSPEDDIILAPTQAMTDSLPEPQEDQDPETEEDVEEEKERVSRRAHRSEGGDCVSVMPVGPRVTKSLGFGLNPREKVLQDLMNGSSQSLQDFPTEERDAENSPASPPLCTPAEVTTPEQRSQQHDTDLPEEETPELTEDDDQEEVNQTEEEEDVMETEPTNQSPEPSEVPAPEEEEEEDEEEEEEEEELPELAEDDDPEEVNQLVEEEDVMETEPTYQSPEPSEVPAPEEAAEEEEEEEEDDDARSAELSMKTPAFVKQRRAISSPTAQATPTALKELNAGPTPQITKRPPRRKPQTGSNALPKSYVMSVFKHFAKTKVAADVFPVINEILQKYFDRLADDLEAYAGHAKRKTIEVEDFELLMRRQGFVTDSTPVNVLIERYLPLEYRKLLIPVATSGNKVIPTQRR